VFHVDDVQPIANRPRRALRILCSHELLDATWSVFEGGERGAEPHLHRGHVDAFYVVDGELTFRVGPSLTPLHAGPGTFVLVPPGIVHAFDNDSDSVARWLNFHSPSTGFAQYLRGERDGFDSFDPPADGGLDPGLVVVSNSGALHPLLSLATNSATEATSPADVMGGFFVLDGEVEFTLGERSLTGGPGTWMAAAPGEAHAVRGQARVLNVRAPAET
jgi:quercetin dioxygenase-like cupin family protein